MTQSASPSDRGETYSRPGIEWLSLTRLLGTPRTGEDGIHRCVHCETSGVDKTYTYCPNCGAVACDSHSKTERLEGEPVCTGCAVTERFALKTKYFYDEENRDAFREAYADMPLHEKAMENKPLVAGSVTTALLLLGGLLVTFGVV